MLTELYTVHRSELYNYCCMMCGNKSEAEDLLQESFIKAILNMELLEELGEKQRRAWLYKVARNLFYDRCRRAALEKRNPVQEEETIEEGFSNVEVGMILSSLPADLSAIFIKRYFEGYTSGEIAEEYGMSASGVRASLSRARAILRDEIREG